MKPFHSLKQYFNFNKRERNGILVLLSVLVLTIIFRTFLNTRSTPLSVKITYLDSLSNSIDTSSNSFTAFPASQPEKINSTGVSQASSPLFIFDPNSINEQQAIQLGFPKKLAKTLIKYCSKGGKFRNKEDLKKLYGMNERLYARLEPYILVEHAAQASQSKFQTNTPPGKAGIKYEKPALRIIELNSADSIQLVSLNGIGPSFARKILKFRNALGGFYSKEQLHEVYGMKDTLYALFAERISVDVSRLKKLNPNVCAYEEMKKHPYINHNIALSIVNYRSKHGPFKSPEDLKETGTISSEVLERIKPYLEF